MIHRFKSPVKTCLSVCLLTLGGGVQAGWFDCQGTAMTTPIAATLWAPPGSDGQALCEAALGEFHRVESVMSTYRENTELSRINRLAGQGAVITSGEVFGLLQQSYQMSVLTGGAFDMTFASAGRLYDYRARQQPSDQQLEAALPAIDYRLVRLDPEDRSVRYGRQGVRVDLGGIAKGYAVDQAIELLRHRGVQSARVSAGGDMRLLGGKREGEQPPKPWVVGIRDPRATDPQKHTVVLPLADVAISTSGDYERYFIEDEERVHHILSPQSGKPVRGVQSVTILGPDTTTTDGLSTAVFVMGAQAGLDLINRLPGIDAIIIDDARQMHYSQGLGTPDKPPEREN